jgi:hypothetical protein
MSIARRFEVSRMTVWEKTHVHHETEPSLRNYRTPAESSRLKSNEANAK